MTEVGTTRLSIGSERLCGPGHVWTCRAEARRQSRDPLLRNARKAPIAGAGPKSWRQSPLASPGHLAGFGESLASLTSKAAQ